LRMCLKVEDSSTRAYRYEVPQTDCSIGPLFKVPSIFTVLVFLFIQREGECQSKIPRVRPRYPNLGVHGGCMEDVL
jgi:hypothetical protein